MFGGMVVGRFPHRHDETPALACEFHGKAPYVLLVTSPSVPELRRLQLMYIIVYTYIVHPNTLSVDA